MDSAKSTAKSAKVRVNTQHTEHTEHTELTQHTHTQGSHSSVAFQAEFPQLRALSTSIPTHGHLPWMEVAQFLNQDMYDMSSVPSHCVPSVQSGTWHNSRFLSSFSSDVFFVFFVHLIIQTVP